MGCEYMKNEIKKKHRMILDEHGKMGKELQDVRNILVVDGVDLDRIYGTTKELGLKLVRATKLIDEVRSDLEDTLFDEYPDLETEDGCKYYY
jgi:hypothetical protein